MLGCIVLIYIFTDFFFFAWLLYQAEKGGMPFLLTIWISLVCSFGFCFMYVHCILVLGV